jgi:type II secretory pathway predicted ATPase ExeA
MYEAFFGLAGCPFPTAPDPARYFATAALENARQTLTRCIHRGEGVALVIGPAGTGKTLLCKLLAQQWAEPFQVVQLWGGAITNRRALFQAILRELELPYRLDEGELRLTLADYIEHGPSRCAGLVILIDEAQSLSVGLLEELRLLTNLTREGQGWVRVVLVGGTELEERFASPKLESLNQRVTARCYLQPLDKEETRGYVASCLASCGGKAESIFTPDALDRLHTASDGVPRVINQVCDHALVLAFAGGKRKINGEGIEEAWADLQQLPVPARPASREPASSGDVVEFGTLEDVEPAPPAVESPPSSLRPIAAEASHHLERIEAHLGQLEQEFGGQRSAKPAAPFRFRDVAPPRKLEFHEEEIVVDRYARLEAKSGARRVGPSAASAPPALQPSAVGSVPVPPHRGEPSASGPSSGRPIPLAEEFDSPGELEETGEDLIVVEDDVATLPIQSAPQAPRVKRQEYRQLFARLRRG